MKQEIHLTESSERRNSSWDVKNGPRNYFALILAQGGSAFFAFASVWLITRAIGSEGYGGVVAVIAASQVVQVLVNWTGTAVVRFGVDEFVETGKIVRIFWSRLLILLVNGTLVLLAAPLWFPLLADWLKLSPGITWLLFFHFAASALWLHMQMSLQAVKLPRLQGWLLMAERLLIFASLAAVLMYDGLSPLAAVTCFAAVPALMVLAGMLRLRHFIFGPVTIDRAFVKTFLLYSLPLLPFSLVGYFSTGYVDTIFVSKFLSTGDLGIYSVAAQTNGIGLQLPTLANSLLLPLFITLFKEAKTGQASNYFNNILPNFVLAWGLACSAAAFTGYFAIPLLFGEAFAGAVLPFWILTSAAVVSLPVLMGYSSYSNALSRTYISMFAAIFAAAANIAFNFLLIPRFGMAGCAWATVITYLVSTLTFAVCLRRESSINMVRLILVFLPAIGGALCFFLTGNSYLSLLIAVVLTAAVAALQLNSLKETFNFVKRFRKS